MFYVYIATDSTVLKFATKAFSSMKQSHILPYMEPAKCRSMLLSSYIKNGMSSSFTQQDIGNIEGDLMKAITFLEKMHSVHGNVSEDFILIEKVSLTMCNCC